METDTPDCGSQAAQPNYFMCGAELTWSPACKYCNLNIFKTIKRTSPYITITIVPLVPAISFISPALISNTHLCFPIWPVSIRASPRPSLSCSPHCSYTVWVLHSALHEGTAEPPIHYCAHNLRWQVKWLTYPLGLLIQGSRTYRHLRWRCALHVRVEVRWGKRDRWERNQKSFYLITIEFL